MLVRLRLTVAPDGHYISGWLRVPGDDYRKALDTVEGFLFGWELATGLNGIIEQITTFSHVSDDEILTRDYVKRFYPISKA